MVRNDGIRLLLLGDNELAPWHPLDNVEGIIEKKF